MPTKESQLVTQIAEAILAEYSYAWVFKVVGNPYQMTGVPDLLVCIEGHLFGLEVKHPYPNETPDQARSRTSPTQRVQIRRINRAGGTAATVVTAYEALALIARVFKEKKKEK